MDIAKILTGKYHDRKWAINGDTYDGLVMLDGLPKPSEAELESHWPEVQAEELKAKTNAEIFAKLEEIDKKSIRALRDGDTIYIENYRAEAEEERKKILK